MQLIIFIFIDFIVKRKDFVKSYEKYSTYQIALVLASKLTIIFVIDEQMQLRGQSYFQIRHLFSRQVFQLFFIITPLHYTLRAQFIRLYVTIQLRFTSYECQQIKVNYYVIMQRLQKLKGDLVPQKFKYTRDTGCLTLQQRKFYEQNGYIVVKGFLKHEDIEKWKVRFLEYCDNKVPTLPGMQIVRDISLVKKNKGKQLTGEANITKLQDFQFDQILQSYCTNPDLIPYLKSFCGENIKSVHTMFINKPPGMGGSSRHPFHQDLAYFPFGPADNIVAAWAALQDSNSQNGSLNILPKTHKGRFYDHEYPDWDGNVNKAYFGIKTYEKFQDNRINLDMKKGDIVFFHPLLIHGSGENKSKGFRKSMCCHFASAECEYIPIEGTVQELVAKEVMSYAKAKFPFLVDYHSLWRNKSALVHGQDFEGKL